jgi:hypothetical protein
MKEIVRILIVTGLMLVATAILLYLFSWLTGGEKFPGDIVVKGKRMTFYFPIVSCIVISIVFTIILNIFFRAH